MHVLYRIDVSVVEIPKNLHSPTLASSGRPLSCADGYLSRRSKGASPHAQAFHPPCQPLAGGQRISLSHNGFKSTPTYPDGRAAEQMPVYEAELSNGHMAPSAAELQMAGHPPGEGSAV